MTRKDGIWFGGKQYESPIVDKLQWAAHARNFGGWDIPANYFPGSVSKIWVPNPTANGLLDLTLSDYSTASPDLTVDEVLDAFMFGKSNNAQVEHEKMIHALQSQHKIQEIVNNAKELTAEAIARYSGVMPTMKESRSIELSNGASATAQQSSSGSTNAQISPDEANEMHLEMMHSILAAANAECPNG